jgi:predicted nuclease with TOPRIM domain
MMRVGTLYVRMIFDLQHEKKALRSNVEGKDEEIKDLQARNEELEAAADEVDGLMERVRGRKRRRSGH